MRVIFFGTAEFAVPSLERISRSAHELMLCVTQPDRPQGRGLRLEPSPVKQAAARLKLPVAQPERLDAAQFAPLHPDIGVAVAYGKILTRELLEVPSSGFLGVHPSLLPKFRGAAPVPWTILSGDRETGVTIFRLNEAMDAGDLLSQTRVAVGDQETSEELLARLAALGAEALVLGLDAIEAGQARFTPQSAADATLAPKLTKEHGALDWSQPAETLARLVRAMTPWPGGWTAWRGATLKIWRAEAARGGAGQPPGTLIAAGPEGIEVAAGRGVLRLLELQPAGKTRMSAQQVAAGYRPRIGERFGSSHEGTHA